MAVGFVAPAVALAVGGAESAVCLATRRRAKAVCAAKAETVESMAAAKGPVEGADEDVKKLGLLNVQAFIVGGSAGVIGSLIGAGGGIVLTPLLTSVLKVSQHDAHGTALVAVAVSSLLGCMAYARGNSVAFVVALVLCVAAVFTSRLGAIQSQKIDAKKLRTYFGGFLLLLAVFLQLQTLLTAMFGRAASTGALTLSQVPILIGAGSATGFVSGLLGIGGGTLMVPILTLVIGLPQKVAQGTALAAMVLPAMMGCYTYLSQGCVKLRILPGLLTGISLGASLGGSYALMLPETVLRLLCGAVFTLSGLKLLGIRVGPSPKPTLCLEEGQKIHPNKYVWDTFVLDYDSYDSEDCDYMGAGI